MSYKIDEKLKEFGIQDINSGDLHDDFVEEYSQFTEAVRSGEKTKEELDLMDKNLVVSFGEKHKIEDPEEEAAKAAAKKAEEEAEEAAKTAAAAKEKEEKDKQSKLEAEQILKDKLAKAENLLKEKNYNEAKLIYIEILKAEDKEGDLAKNLTKAIKDIDAAIAGKVNWTEERLAKAKETIKDKSYIKYSQLHSMGIEFPKGKNFEWNGMRFYKRFLVLEYEVEHVK